MGTSSEPISTNTNANAPELPGSEALMSIKDITLKSHGKYHMSYIATQAADANHGEQIADEFLEKVHADMANPDDLAAIVTCVREEVLAGLCRVIGTALRVGGASHV